MGVEGKSLFSWLKKKKSKKLFCFDDGNKGEPLTEKQKEIFEVTFGTRKKTELHDSEGNIILYEKGNRRYGANHIKKHFGYKSTGALLYIELFLIEEVLQKGKVNNSKTRVTDFFESVVYEYERENRFLFVVVKKQITTGAQSVLSYFSSEYFTDHNTQKIREGSQDQPNSYSSNLLYQKNRDITKKQERDYTAGQPNSCSNIPILSQKDEIVKTRKFTSFYKKELYSNLPLECLSLMDTVFRSPGVHPAKITKYTGEKNQKKISSSTQLFLDLCPTKKIIGVTGTKGKGTTSSLLYEIIQESQNEANIANTIKTIENTPSETPEKVFLGGNIGTPVFDFFDEVSGNDTVILELSSFQLYDITSSPQMAIVLRTESEHLDWHCDVDDYRNAKKNIFAFQKKENILIHFAKESKTPEIVLEARSQKIEVFPQKEKRSIKSVKEKTEWIDVLETGEIVSSISSLSSGLSNSNNEKIFVSDIALRGSFHQENVLPALAMAQKIGIKNSISKRVVSRFIGLPMRCEHIATKRGISFFNDSFSTIPETTVSALSTFSSSVYCIIGGSEKHSDFSELSQYCKNHNTLKMVFVMGETANRIIKTFEKNKFTNYKQFSGLEEIFTYIAQKGKTGDSIVMSPACASFDMFPNYKKRGEFFNQLVESFV